MRSRWAPIAALLPFLTSAAWAPAAEPWYASEEPLRYSSRMVDERQLLAYDQSGRGRIVEVFGDLGDATAIAVLVPGNGHTLNNYDLAEPHGLRRAGRALHAELSHLAPDEPTAVVTWLGYTTASGAVDLESARSERAIAAAPNLARLTRELPTDARVTLTCHSYGSVVCGHAASHAHADAIVALASPGMDAGSVTELDTRASIWAARTGDDPIAYVPNLRLGGFGHATDPTSSSFGATVFATGPITGHSRYYEPGSESLSNIARIVLGRTDDATPDAAHEPMLLTAEGDNS